MPGWFLRGQQLAKCFSRFPALVVMAERRRVRINQSHKHLGHNPATNGTETTTACTCVGFTQNVIPERCLAMPTRGSDANLLLRKRGDSHVTRDGLARRQPDALSALQITDGERVIIFDLAGASHGYRQFDECADQLSVYFLAALRSCRSGGVEEQRPINRAFTRYGAESQ